VATEFVIGGLSFKNDEEVYDGKILQAIPDKSNAWHLGIGNQAMHRESIGIEL
jgi:N-acetyl-anhydromuramyl-L-alanine amidase AmpD